LAIHLIPTAIVLIVLAVSWRWEWIGGIAYVALGILYMVMAWRRFPLGVYFMIAGPLVLTGILFLINSDLLISPGNSGHARKME
jgi:hypothetical protein